MSIYLHDIPLNEAKKRLEQALAEVGRGGLLGVEDLPLDEWASGRVLAETVWAKISSPHYHASAMDGFAVRSEDTSSASLNRPTHFRYLQEDRDPAPTHQTVYVDTGDPLPAWA